MFKPIDTSEADSITIPFTYAKIPNYDIRFHCFAAPQYITMRTRASLVEWGDGTYTDPHTREYSLFQHTYSEPGIYNIVIHDWNLDLTNTFEYYESGELATIDLKLPQSAKHWFYDYDAERVYKTPFVGFFRGGELTLPHDSIFVPKTVFNMAQFEKLHLPETIAYVDEQAFRNATFKDFHFSKRLQEIAPRAFNRALHMSTIDLPQSLRRIGADAFYFANNDPIKKVIVRATTPPVLGSGNFNLPVDIYVPDESYDEYLDSPWGSVSTFTWHKISELEE